MIDDYKIYLRDRDLSKPTWDYITEKKPFGMIIPEAFGGLGFIRSPGHWQVVAEDGDALGGRRGDGDGAQLARPRRAAHAVARTRSARTPAGAPPCDIIPFVRPHRPPSGSGAAAMRDGGIVERRESDGALGVATQSSRGETSSRALVAGARPTPSP